MTERQAIKIIYDEKRWESENRKIDAFTIAIDALEEIQKYRELERKLNGVDLTMLVNHFMEKAAEGEIQGYQRGRILTNEDADKWDAYLSIGTPDECRAAVEKQIAKKPKEYEDKFYGCPVCGNVLLHKWEKYPTKLADKKNGLSYCFGCGQKLDWSDGE